MIFSRKSVEGILGAMEESDKPGLVKPGLVKAPEECS
jgi:hypothetical protein